jgi:hypothetical protein
MRHLLTIIAASGATQYSGIDWPIKPKRMDYRSDQSIDALLINIFNFSGSLARSHAAAVIFLVPRSYFPVPSFQFPRSVR